MDKYALISVHDKTKVVDLAQRLVEHGYHIISTGGTARILGENNINVIPVEAITGNPECLGGRMKTISFEIESGILFDRKNSKHQNEAKKLNIKPIDIVVCNFYPFEKIVGTKKLSLREVVEYIDIGGPTMVRAAAKNFHNVLVVVYPEDYRSVSEALTHKSIPLSFRQSLAAKAFAHASLYDAQVAGYLEKEPFPKIKNIAARKVLNLRSGENPHQQAAFYLEPNTQSPFERFEKIAGRDLSLTNLTDINAGIESVRMFDEPAAVVIKHNTPCGIALGETPSQALERAIDADPLSAFGGIIVLNKPFDIRAALIVERFRKNNKSVIDIIAACSFHKDAIDLLGKVRKTTGIYSFGPLKTQGKRENFKWIDGGFVVQTADDDIESSFRNWKIVTNVKPIKQQIRQMQIAWKFASRIKSNTIVIVDAKIPMTRGIGSGQTSRFGSTQIAIKQAGSYTYGGILASDSFFPFDDSLKLAAKHKIAAIVQQGGSIHDNEIIKKANQLKIPMVFTGRRAFWH